MPAASCHLSPTYWLRVLPLALCLLAIAVDLAMLNHKGISTDEGIRLAIINGNHAFVPDPQPPWPTYGEVLQTLKPFAYQPAYYLLQSTVMRLTGRSDLFVFRLVNVILYALALGGILALSRTWTTWVRTFLIGLFAFNAYLIMHVLQIREYTAAVVIYVWGTWLVLRLDRQELNREWQDVGWFLGYALLLTLGFYLQTWTVFPAIGQGVFLVLRRRPQIGRFLAHLGMSYVIVFILTWPYLENNPQKINVGLWATEQVTLLGQLANGFSLVLSGHLIGYSWFTNLLSCTWLLLVFVAGGLLWRLRRRLPEQFVVETTRQTWLMSICVAVPLAFQIAYYFKVEPLSVWPRYFIVHYFFLVWLIVLAFRTLSMARTVDRKAWNLGALVMASVLAATSAVYQVWSYWIDPYFDTGMSAASNWDTIGQAIGNNTGPGDLILTCDFTARATLTASHPLPNPVMTLLELEKTPLHSMSRIVYLESFYVKDQRTELFQKLADLGFPAVKEVPILASIGHGPVHDWCILIFSPR